MIYAMQADLGPVKVGWSATRLGVKARRYSLQSRMPFTLRMLDVAPGEYEDEQRLHRMLAPWRMRGEWYRPDEAVLRVAGDLAVYADAEWTLDRWTYHGLVDGDGRLTGMGVTYFMSLEHTLAVDGFDEPQFHAR